MTDWRTEAIEQMETLGYPPDAWRGDEEMLLAQIHDESPEFTLFDGAVQLEIGSLVMSIDVFGDYAKTARAMLAALAAFEEAE